MPINLWLEHIESLVENCNIEVAEISGGFKG